MYISTLDYNDIFLSDHHALRGCEYAEIALVLDKTESAVRKLVSRADRRVANSKLKFNIAPIETELLLKRFSAACSSKSHEEVLSLLAPDATAISDGGGRVRAALRPLVGAQEVTQVLLSIVRRFGSEVSQSITMVNGQPALSLSNADGETTPLSLGVNELGKINWIYIMRNPENLSSA